MEPDSKKRKKPSVAFSEDEVEELMRLVTENISVIECQNPPTVGTPNIFWKRKAQVWDTIASEFQASGLGFRDSSALKNKWVHLKMEARKQAARATAAHTYTGGGPYRDVELPGILQRVLDLCDKISMRGHVNRPDDDELFTDPSTAINTTPPTGVDLHSVNDPHSYTEYSQLSETVNDDIMPRVLVVPGRSETLQPPSSTWEEEEFVPRYYSTQRSENLDETFFTMPTENPNHVEGNQYSNTQGHTVQDSSRPIINSQQLRPRATTSQPRPRATTFQPRPRAITSQPRPRATTPLPRPSTPQPRPSVIPPERTSPRVTTTPQTTTQEHVSTATSQVDYFNLLCELARKDDVRKEQLKEQQDEKHRREMKNLEESWKRDRERKEEIHNMKMKILKAKHEYKMNEKEKDK